MHRRAFIRRASAALAAASLSPSAVASDEQLRVAVAANFVGTLQKIAKDWDSSGGVKIALIPGSSGKLLEQIKNGAPFDVLLSADSERPEAVEKAGLAPQGSRFTYAIGRLALWSAEPGMVDSEGMILARGDFRRLAIASPKSAPYGAAALQAIEKLGLSSMLKEKLVTGENIAQAMQFVETGNAQLGFVALSQILERPEAKRGSYWIVPDALHAPIEQQAVAIAKGPRLAEAERFLRFLRAPAARKLIEADGYRLPKEP